MSEDQFVGYYCRNCKEPVECELAVWARKVSLIPPHRIKVEVSAKCPNCSAVLARGDGIIELY